jgi:zinc transporter ZupT
MICTYFLISIRHTGIAVFVASVVAWRGSAISYGFLVRLGMAIDEICEEAGYRKIYFLAPKNIVKLFQYVSALLAVVGILFVAHVLFFDRGWQQIVELYSARWN